ncbi:cystine/glutamate transporter-like isoform X2 [Rhea pennata]|uniref:cystine/glutamate transporter-like isoform X2 n=1 Tax=Rhea pennata TaxID=8795 RepID=UPI002E26DB3D
MGKDKKEEEAVFLRKKITLLRAFSLLIGSMVGSGIFVSPKGVLKNSGSVGFSLTVWFACGLLSMFGGNSFLSEVSPGLLSRCLELCRAWNKNHQVWRTLYLHIGDIRASAKFLISVGRVFCYQACQQCCGFFGVRTLHAGAFFCPLYSSSPCCEACVSPGILHCPHAEFLECHLECPGADGPLHHQTPCSCPHHRTRDDASGPRNIPLAVIVSVITVIVGYMLTNVSYYTVLGTQDVLASPAVAVSFVQRTFKSLISVVPVLVALSCFGTMNGGIFTFSRTLFVASREGQWPPLFSMIHIRRHTPLPAVMLMFPLVTAMVCIGDIYHLMNFFSFSRWLFIGLATLGLIVHRYRHPEVHSPFQVPLFIPVSFTIICLFTVGMSFYSDPVNISIGCTVVLSGFPVYYLAVHRRMPDRCHSLFYYLTHKLQVLLEVVQQEIKTY